MKLSEIKGIGAQMEKKLGALGIATIGDLMSFFPSKYVDLGLPTSVINAEEGQFYLFEGEVVRVKEQNSRKKSFSITFRDSIAVKPVFFNAVFFNQPYLKSQFEIGKRFRLFSKITDAGINMLINPTIEPADNLKLLTKGIFTVYPLKNEIGQRTFKKLVLEAFTHTGYNSNLQTINGNCTDIDNYCSANSEFALYDTLYKIHFPKTFEEGERAVEELSAIDFAMGLKTYQNSKKSAVRTRKTFYCNCEKPKDIFEKVIDFPLTASQSKAIDDIVGDMLGCNNMSRIISGDVGSGKSVVAYFAMTFASMAGKQTAYMCPTEILATQQYEKFKIIADKLNISIALLTSSTKSAERRAILSGLADGTISAIFGTQSLAGKDVEYNNLALAVIDEQHKFGVSCRAELENKGANDVLTLTATPIPRTLALTLYDDIDVSSIYKRESAKTNISTKILSDQKLDGLVEYVKTQCKENGKQAFFVCPTIKDSDGLDIYSVEKFYATYSEQFGNLSTSILHGRMSNADKNAVMTSFSKGEIDILFATSLIEVGIDTKASIIAILNADRFGLASLHQLRGRVGRDGLPAYCFLHTKSLGVNALDRLVAMENFDDGLMLAEKDLEMRGAGDFLGTKQKGITASPYFKLPSSAKVLLRAKEMSKDVKYDKLTEVMSNLFGADYSDFENSLKSVTLNS
ncbi:MAG: ATP-dependent DNA helicase RecG [Clostridia bacterium]|nr:ATP-dependent DNA helicase RecG [Clostridia bacterium]